MIASAIPTWVKTVVILAPVAVLLWGVHAYGRQQFGLGEQAERSVWLARENTALATANVRIKALEDQARAREREHAQDMAAASAKYQEDLKHEKTTKDRVIADLRSGALRLRVPIVSNSCADAAGGSAATASGPGAAGRDGGASAELSGEAAEFLVGLTSEADEVVYQLKACQAVVAADRKQPREQ